MAKSHDAKKSAQKKPQMTLMEKRQAKHAKKAARTTAAQTAL